MSEKPLSPKQEKFAQYVFEGLSEVDAYERAGYKPHRQNSNRLFHDPRVKAYVKDMQRQAVNKVVSNEAFTASRIFSRLMNRADAAAEAGDHNAAIKAEMYIAKCLGYEDSPTLTHEHLTGKTTVIPAEPSPDRTDGRGNVVPLNKALAKMREIKASKK